MNAENIDIPDIDDEEVRQILGDSGMVEHLLQMRTLGRDGDTRVATLAVMKVGDMWFCANLDVTESSGRRKMSRSRKSLRTALNREIKKFLDDEGFDDDAPLISLQDLVDEAKGKQDEGSEQD